MIAETRVSITRTDRRSGRRVTREGSVIRNDAKDFGDNVARHALVQWDGSGQTWHHVNSLKTV